MVVAVSVLSNTDTGTKCSLSTLCSHLALTRNVLLAISTYYPSFSSWSLLGAGIQLLGCVCGGSLLRAEEGCEAAARVLQDE